VSISKGRRWKIFVRDDFRCRYCGRRAPNVELHVDHVHPVSRGGTDKESNLVTACVDCNLGKTNRVLPTFSPLEEEESRSRVSRMMWVGDVLEMLGFQDDVPDSERAAFLFYKIGQAEPRDVAHATQMLRDACAKRKMSGADAIEMLHMGLHHARFHFLRLEGVA
jgi:hypothetical protein